MIWVSLSGIESFLGRRINLNLGAHDIAASPWFWSDSLLSNKSHEWIFTVLYSFHSHFYWRETSGPGIRRELSLRICSDPNNYYLESVPLPYGGLALHRVMEKTLSNPLHEELPNRKFSEDSNKDSVKSRDGRVETRNCQRKTNS